MSLNKVLSGTLIIQLVVLGTLVLKPAQVKPQTAHADPISQKDPSPPDPYRPYYDGFGNQFRYDGKLLHATCPNVPDPISGKDNPYCVCTAPGSFIRGMDKETGAVACGVVTGCPYGDSIPLGPACDKFAPQPEAVDFGGK